MPRIKFDRRYKKFRSIDLNYPVCLAEVFVKETRNLSQEFLDESQEYVEGGYRDIPWGEKVLVLLFHQSGNWFPELRGFDMEKARYYYSQRGEWFKLLIDEQ